MSLSKYTDLKDAAAEWVGRIPLHWEETRLRYIADISNSNVDKKEYEGQVSVRLCNYTDVYYNEVITPDLNFMIATASKAETKKFGLKLGDVIITKDSEDPLDIGIPAIVDCDIPGVVCGYHLSIIRAEDPITADYIRYSFMSDVNKARMYVRTPGITRFGLNQDTIKNILVLLPSMEERGKIVAALRRETARIDGLIEKKGRFIELLKEKRSALITHAVTKGFDADLPMKDSGVGWVGSIPVHWEETRLRFIANISNSNVDKKEYEGQVPVRLCNYTDVYYNEIITPDLDFMIATASKVEVKKFGLKAGDVIITKDSEDPLDIGIPAIVESDMPSVVCGYHLSVIRAEDPITADYIRYSFISDVNKAHMYVRTPGITRFGLNQDTIKNILVLLPPMEERAKIVAELRNETQRIDGLVVKTKCSIELLKEKRSALITAAVTGKIDVRSTV